MMYQGSQTHLHSLAGKKKGVEIFQGRQIYFKIYSEMRGTVCASEKLMFYTHLSYLDFTLEPLSSGPGSLTAIVLSCAFPFAPRPDG